MPLLNNQEQKINVWEIPEVKVAYWTDSIGGMVLGVLPDNVSRGLGIPDYGSDFQKTNQLISTTKQHNPEDGYAYGVNKSVYIKKSASSAEEVTELNSYIDRVHTAALAQADKRGDARTKQYYEDAAFLVDRTKGNIAETVFSSPYINPLLAQRMSLTIPTEYSSAEQKRGLTVPLYEAIYDFNHATIGEIAVDYRRQKFEKEGWNKESEAKYLAELHNAHSRVLYHFNKLSKFRDDPQNNTAHYTQDTLRDTFGTGNSGRNVTHAIGMIRGEKKAIENGWGKDELILLGMLGGIEEEMKLKSLINRKDEFKESFPQFKSDFAKLKNECFYSTVTTPAEKLAIANKIKTFIDTQNSPAAVSCLEKMDSIKDRFNEIYNKISADVEQLGEEQANINAEKNNDPENYLKDLFEAGRVSGTYSIFVREYIDTIVKATNSQNSQAALEACNKVIISIGENNEGTISDFRKQSLISYLELTIACANEEEQLAEDIRAGRVEVAGNILPFAGAYKDEAFSREYAKHLLLNSDLNQKRRAAKEICRDISAQLGVTADLESLKRDYIKNSMEGLGERQTSVILKDSLEDFEKLQDTLYDVTIGIKGQPQAFSYNDLKFAQNYNKAKSDWHKYGKKQNEIGLRASSLRDRAMELANYKPTAVYDRENKRYHRQGDVNAVIDPKSANSQTFMNLINALDKVDKLNSSYTPNQILEAYRNLRDAAKAYNEKIDSHTFAGRRTNGKQRRTLSGEVYDFAKNAIKQLENTPDYMEMNVSLTRYDEQLTLSVMEAKEAFRPEVLEKLGTEKENCLNRRFDYKENHDFKYNKKQLVSGMAELLVIRTLTSTATDNYGEIIAPGQITHDFIKDESNLLTGNQAFKDLTKSIKTEEDVRNMMQQMKDNPASVFDEYNKHTPEHKAAMEALNKINEKRAASNQIENNNIIQNGP